MSKKIKIQDLAEVVIALSSELSNTKKTLKAITDLMINKNIANEQEITSIMNDNNVKDLEQSLALRVERGQIKECDEVRDLTDIVVYKALPEILFGYKQLKDMPKDSQQLYMNRKAGDMLHNGQVEILKVYRMNHGQA